MLRECFVSGSRENCRRYEALELNVDLLREHVTTKRNTPVQGHRGKISTLTAFHVGPSHQSRDDARHSGAHESQQAEVSVDGAYTAVFLRALRAKVQKLDDAREVFAGSG